jgi:quercetin dioxygenase-like cupin family protein/mannose-6-phosphate isomerase-like protein (cupin superfamily)
MTKRILIFVLLFLSAILFAQTITEVSIDKEPAHHFAMENDFVRVFDVVVAPHAATLMHRHDRDYMFVILGDSDISNERMNEKPVHLVVKDGDVRYSKGGFAHIARNTGDTPFHNITIELKNPGKPVCGVSPAADCKNDLSNIQNVFSTEHVNVQLTTMEPGQQQPVHTHAGPHLAIAVDDLTFENHVSDKPTVPISMKKGEFKWIPVTGMNHYLKNVGNRLGRLISIEFN